MRFSTICYIVSLSGLAAALPTDDKSKAPVAPSVVPVPKPSGVAPPVISVVPKPPVPSGPAAPPKPSGTGGLPWGPKPSWVISVKPPVGTGKPPKPTKSAVEPPKPTKSAAEPPKPTKSAAEPPKPTKSAEKPKPTPW